MRRADRLFEIIQLLRRTSAPMTAERIAAELETSKRTIYRDIDALAARRVPIRGEAGIGYVLESGFDMPPLMLTSDEAEAVALGLQWVVAHADDALARAAVDTLAKVAAIVPDELRGLIEDPAVSPPPRWDGGIPSAADDGTDVARLRRWCRDGRRLAIEYRDEAGSESERVIRPFLVGYVSAVRVVAAWCELREDFRIFRTDRLCRVEYLDTRYPDRPAKLRRRWLKLMRERHADRGPTGRSGE